MKLRNKKTGEIVPASNVAVGIGDDGRWYESLAELNEEWEDYEEPTEIWYIDWKGDIRSADFGNEWSGEKSIGNYFETKEEAEKAVEKLKAWKRLKDKGFRFESYKHYGAGITFAIAHLDTLADEETNDLDLLFGSEE